jgi:uracil-DNA glycosylase family 4
MSEDKEYLWNLYNEVIEYIDGDDTHVREYVPPQVEYLEEDKPSIYSTLKELEVAVSQCTLCRLSETRHLTVLGEGPSKAKVMVIGEGPGSEEDKEGRPFVGKAGVYLDAWLKSISLDRTRNCYITNIVKCRPPHNRDPHEDEALACLAYLERQIELVKPEGILCVGKVAAHYLLKEDKPLGQLREKIHLYQTIPVVVTYHPSAVLRNQQLRGAVWEDLQQLAQLLHLPLVNKRG